MWIKGWMDDDEDTMEWMIVAHVCIWGEGERERGGETDVNNQDDSWMHKVELPDGLSRNCQVHCLIICEVWTSSNHVDSARTPKKTH